VRRPAAAARRPSSLIGSRPPARFSRAVSNIAGPSATLLGEDVATGVGCPAYRVLGGGGAGQLGRICEVDSHLEYPWLRLEHRGEPGDEVLRRKEPPSWGQMQPVPRIDLSADLAELGAVGELEESVAVGQRRAILGGHTGVDDQEALDPVDVGASSAVTS